MFSSCTNPNSWSKMTFSACTCNWCKGKHYKVYQLAWIAFLLSISGTKNMMETNTFVCRYISIFINILWDLADDLFTQQFILLTHTLFKQCGGSFESMYSIRWSAPLAAMFSFFHPYKVRNVQVGPILCNGLNIINISIISVNKINIYHIVSSMIMSRSCLLDL